MNRNRKSTWRVAMFFFSVLKINKHRMERTEMVMLQRNRRQPLTGQPNLSKGRHSYLMNFLALITRCSSIPPPSFCITQVHLFYTISFWASLSVKVYMRFLFLICVFQSIILQCSSSSFNYWMFLFKPSGDCENNSMSFTSLLIADLRAWCYWSGFVVSLYALSISARKK